jgi:hypothetical protein
MTLDDPLLTPPQAAAHLSVSVGTLANWRTAGKGPSFVRLGSSPKAAIRYRKSALERFAADNPRVIEPAAA